MLVIGISSRYFMKSAFMKSWHECGNKIAIAIENEVNVAKVLSEHDQIKETFHYIFSFEST